MQPLTDKNLNYWADVYQSLHSEYSLFLHLGMSFELFIKQPAFYHHWIIMYMSNQRLFDYFYDDNAIGLVDFLINPDEVFKQALALDAKHETISKEFLPLMWRQDVALKVQGVMQQYGIQEFYERYYFKHRERKMELRGGPLMETFHRYAPCKKHKTGRMSHV